MNRTRRLTAQFLVLFALWLLLSGRFDPAFLAMGVLSAAVVTALTHDVLFDSLEPLHRKPLRPFLRLWRISVYFAWLLLKIISGNLQVAYAVCHPRLPIDPHFLRFRTRVRSRFGRIMLANSITLTPGTVTVELRGNEFLVHVLTPRAAADLVSGRLQRIVAAMFLEEDEPVDAQWLPVPLVEEGEY